MPDLIVGHFIDEDLHDAVIVLVEEDVGDHHAVARCDTGIMIRFYFHGIHQVTASDFNP